LNIVAIFFGLPDVELTIFEMCNHLAVLPVAVSHDIPRARGSPLETVYRHAQKLFSMNPRCSLLTE
jgi:hypothetical protein